MSKSVKECVEYLRFIFTWWSLVSGAASIPFAVLSAANFGHTRGLFALLAFCTLLFASFGLVQRILELKETLRPKFLVSCGPSVLGSQVGSTIHWNGSTIGTTFNRVRVEADVVGEIEGCAGTLTLIEKDSQIRMGHETLRLTFAPGDEADATSKVLRGKVPEFLDVFMITEEGWVLPCTKGFKIPNAINPKALFMEHGDYLITVVISGKNVPPQQMRLKLYWSGYRGGSTLTLIENPKERNEPSS